MAFTNNTHKSMVTAFTNAQKDLLKNPYYYFNNSKATIVDYFNINVEQSTLDDSSKIAYDYIGSNCPLKFNHIHEFFLYGIDKIQLSLDNSENGLESGDINGEALILPNTIKPYAGDYFIIDHMISKFLFQIISVDRDTLEDGANFWKVSYRLERVLDQEQNNNLLECLADEFEFDVTTVGTGFKSIVRKSDAEVIKIIEETIVTLKTYYKSLFYSDKVQTFIYPYDTVQYAYIYDSFLIEFILRNELMRSDSSDYIYIEHKLPLPASFSVDYAQTLYRALETKDLENLESYKVIGIGKYIDNKLSIFSTRPYRYFYIDYNAYDQIYHTLNNRMEEKKEEIKTTHRITYTRPVNTTKTTTHGDVICDMRRAGVYPDSVKVEDDEIPNAISTDLPPLVTLSSVVINAIKNNELYDVGVMQKFNVLIKYFNNKDIDVDTITTIENIVYSSYDNDLYFLIPMIIFCLKKYIEKRIK